LAEKTCHGQKAALQQEATKEVIAKEIMADQEMSSDQDMQREKEAHECMDHLTKSTQVKRPHSKEMPHTRKKSKTTKALEKEFMDSSKSMSTAPTGSLE